MILFGSFKDKCHLAQVLQTHVSLNKGTGSPALSVCSNAHQAWSECLAKHPWQQIHHVLLSAAVDASLRLCWCVRGSRKSQHFHTSEIIITLKNKQKTCVPFFHTCDKLSFVHHFRTDESHSTILGPNQTSSNTSACIWTSVFDCQHCASSPCFPSAAQTGRGSEKWVGKSLPFDSTWSFWPRAPF